MGIVCKRIIFVALIVLIVLIVIGNIVGGGYYMIEDLDSFKDCDLDKGIIVGVASTLILIISAIFNFDIFGCCFNTLYIGLLALLGSIGYNSYLLIHMNRECYSDYKGTSELDYYMYGYISQCILCILVFIFVKCMMD